jgi:hypothetical protein
MVEGMSDKLQFVVGFRRRSGLEACNKLKFVGHFLRKLSSIFRQRDGYGFPAASILPDLYK